MRFWRKKNLKPARTQALGTDSVVRDLDALIAESIPFRFKGKVYEIEPITTGNLLVILNKFAQFDKVAKKEGLTADALIDSYLEIFSAACPTITREDIAEMNQAQCAALFQLIFDSCTGKAQSEREERKKKLQELSLSNGLTQTVS
jgi:hypothetical protein